MGFCFDFHVDSLDETLGIRPRTVSLALRSSFSSLDFESKAKENFSSYSYQVHRQGLVLILLSKPGLTRMYNDSFSSEASYRL